MQSATKTALFYVASNRGHNLHYPHCPVGPDSWWKYNQDRANGTTTYKPGPALPMSTVLKFRPIYEELSDKDLLKKCLHDPKLEWKF